MINRFLAALIVAAAAVTPVHAQTWKLHDAIDAPAPLKLSGSTRLRFETIDNQVRPGLLRSESIYALRSNLFAEYTAGPLKVGGELWDSRVYGDKPGTVIGPGEVNTFEPVQAYVSADLKGLLGPGTLTTIKAGRFVVDIGSRRLATNEEYRNATNGYTGVRVDAKLANSGSLYAFYTAPQVRLPDAAADVLDNRWKFDRESSDRFFGLVGAGKGPAGFDIDGSYLGLRERDSGHRATRDRQLDTVALRILRSPKIGRYDLEAEGAWQTGTVSASAAATAAQLKVTAGFVHVRAGYSFDAAWKPRLAFDYDWVSGDAPGGNYSRFDTLFGARRMDFAPAGLFSTVGRANIISPGVRLEVAPTKRLDGFIALRHLQLESKTDVFSTSGVRDATGATGDDAGNQAEGRLRYWLVQDAVRFEANGALLRKSRFLKAAPNAPADKGPASYLAMSVIWTF